MYLGKNVKRKALAKRSQHVNATYRSIVERNMLRASGHPVATCWVLLAKFENGQIRANNTQHVATRRKRVAKRAQHVSPNNVVICCVDMLRSFGRSLKLDFISRF